jgi:fucose permease
LTLLATAPGWASLLIATALLGSAGGQIDAGTNTYVAIRHGSRAMSFLHGAFGLGAIVGPLLITMLFILDLSWRVGFAVLALCELLYLIGLWLYARSLTTPAQARTAQTRSTAGAHKALFWSVAVFFLYAGMATGLGAWVFTFLTEERGVSETSGGLIITAYWAGFTLSRVLLGVIGERANPSNVLIWSGAATFAALTVFWMAPTGFIGTLAFVVAGFAHGPVFPYEMLLTPTRFGDSLTSTVVGYEIAAANVGGATISGIIGVLVDRYGLDVVPGVLLIVALGVWGSIWMLRATSDPENEPEQAATAP